MFLCNPNVDKTFNFNNLNYFYSDHIAGHTVKMMLHNPYVETDFITENGHLIKVWCKMFGVTYNGEQPELREVASPQLAHKGYSAARKDAS